MASIPNGEKPKDFVLSDDIQDVGRALRSAGCLRDEQGVIPAVVLSRPILELEIDVRRKVEFAARRPSKCRTSVAKGRAVVVRRKLGRMSAAFAYIDKAY